MSRWERLRKIGVRSEEVGVLQRVKSGELRVKSTQLKIETGEWKMNVKFDGMHNEHPTNELRDTGITKGIFSCPSGNSPCVAPAEMKPHA